MRTIIRSFLFVAALALCGLAISKTFAQGAGGAQPQPKPTATPQPATPPSQGQEDESITVSIRRVRLPITVVDKKGQPVTGLTSSDFLILEDKKQQVIETFADEKESVPIYVGVLMDTSSSTAGKLKFEQESAKNFMYSVVRLRKDRVAFTTFDDEVTLRQDFTDKLDLLDKAVDSVKKSGGHTSLYDAVWQLCDEKMRSVSGRRVLVVITDGADTYSRATLRDAIDIAQRTETIIFGISTKAGFSGTVPGVEAGQVASGADRDLVKLCEETGGAAFFTGDMLALERSFTKISKELHSQYIITYKPTNDRYDGSFRRIEVKLANKRDGIKVRTKDGYRAVADTIGK
jgi:Ca-activated chloride channel family protein